MQDGIKGYKFEKLISDAEHEISKVYLATRIKDGITSISVCSYGMYFSHVIVLKWITTYNQHSDLMVPVFLILTVFLSWLPVYVMSKIPYLKKVSGV